MRGGYEVSRAHLWKTDTDCLVDAELWDAVTDAQLSDWEKLWKPGSHALRERVRALRPDADAEVAALFWDWSEKAEAVEGLLSSAAFCVVADGITQGMMIVDLLPSCQLQSQKGKPLVYVSYIEVAPWNQKPVPEITPRFTGVGSLLMRAAIELSRENEFSGRVGLHSLPSAESWYRNTCGMTDTGIRRHGLRYFEMTPDQADAFAERREE